MFTERIENLKKINNKQEEILRISQIVKKALLAGNKILFCGNGGSASDSNHLSCEFISKFQKERKSLSAISLCANNSIVTAIANDYHYDDVFKRQIQGIGKKGDVLIALSTSGKSKNVLNAIEQANLEGIKTIFFTGEERIDIKSDVQLNVPSKITCMIQEMHIMVGHIICEIIENSIC